MNIVQRDYFGIPTIGEMANDLLAIPQNQNIGNVTISEDDDHVYVEAAMPGINSEDIEVTYDHGVLWISGETNTEEKGKNKKYYTKASSSFSYKVAVPGDINPNSEPEATCENGLVMVTFSKISQKTPKKISVKSKGNGKAKAAKSEEK